MGPTHSDKCCRNCGTQTGNYTHTSQACPKLKSFWDNVLEALRLVFKQSFMRDPKVAILGFIPLGINGRGTDYYLQILLTAALKGIMTKWLKPDPQHVGCGQRRCGKFTRWNNLEQQLALVLQTDVFNERWSSAMAILVQ